MNPPSPDASAGPRPPTLVFPLCVYIAVTFVAPLVHGAAGHEGFAEHALTALLVPLAMISTWFALRELVRRSRIRRSVPTSRLLRRRLFFW